MKQETISTTFQDYPVTTESINWLEDFITSQPKETIDTQINLEALRKR